MVTKSVSPSVRQLTRLACVCVIGLATLAAAKAEGTAEQRIACTPDVYRLCADQIPNIPGIKACMIAKKSKLSTACRKVFDARG